LLISQTAKAGLHSRLDCIQAAYEHFFSEIGKWYDGRSKRS